MRRNTIAAPAKRQFVGHYYSQRRVAGRSLFKSECIVPFYLFIFKFEQDIAHALSVVISSHPIEVCMVATLFQTSPKSMMYKTSAYLVALGHFENKKQTRHTTLHGASDTHYCPFLISTWSHCPNTE